MPTLQEIEAGVGINYLTVSKYLKMMERMGMLERSQGKMDAIRLIRREAKWNALIDS